VPERRSELASVGERRVAVAVNAEVRCRSRCCNRPTGRTSSGLVILSNTDRDIVEHSLRHLRIRFDDVVTAEDCGTYQPDLAFFDQALARIGVPPQRILHVAFGFKYDHASASGASMATAWVNRHAEPQPEGTAPDHEWRDLWGLAALLDGRTVLP
jgi:2-haloacid dehalogenase